MNKSSHNYEKIKVNSNCVDSFIHRLRNGKVRFELGPSEAYMIDGKAAKLQTIYVDLNTISELRKPRKSDGIYCHSKMNCISKFFVTVVHESDDSDILFYKYISDDVIAMFDNKEEAVSLLKMIEKANPLSDVVVVEHIADADITNEVQLEDNKIYWGYLE